jgi:hypothetical protein
MAQDPKYENVQFISICCDKLDGARDIIEKGDDLRWQNVSHYFMDQKDKEQAKKALGFKSVPFYVVLDESGSITQSGNQKAIDFEEVPGVVRPAEEEPGYYACREGEEKKEDDALAIEFQLDFSLQPQQPPKPAALQVDRLFIIDDLDF